ncbi:hypothetical protein DFH06DRAFT_1323183 [Mycena polygramma]|nr:hypothetical protein DFH06DRAFT_1323183 [Mycena polygramma]
MHSSTALVFALFCTSLVAAAPVAPVASSSYISDVATQSTSAANITVPAVLAADILPAVAVHDQSETSSHGPEFVHSAEKSRRRSFPATLKRARVELSITQSTPAYTPKNRLIPMVRTHFNSSHPHVLTHFLTDMIIDCSMSHLTTT